MCSLTMQWLLTSPQDVVGTHDGLVGQVFGGPRLGQDALEHRLVAHQSGDHLLDSHSLAQLRVLSQVQNQSHPGRAGAGCGIGH